MRKDQYQKTVGMFREFNMTLKEKAQYCWDRCNKLDKKYRHALMYVIQMPEKVGIRTCIASTVENAYKELTNAINNKV